AKKINQQFGTSMTAESVKGYIRTMRKDIGQKRAVVEQFYTEQGEEAFEYEPEEVCDETAEEPDNISTAETDEQVIYDVEHIEDQRDYEKENALLRAANQRLYKKVLQYKDHTDELVRATLDGARDAMLSMGPLKASALAPVAKSRKGVKHEEAALWHMTDWQGSKVTASYNSQVMRERVERFCRKAKLITDIQRADHPVDECVIVFGGDMVEGLFNYPTQAFEIDQTIFGQFTTVSRLIIDTVKYALGMYEHVTVVAEWGNHGRIGSKRSAVPRSDNIDRMTYEMARQVLFMAGET